MYPRFEPDTFEIRSKDVAYTISTFGWCVNLYLYLDSIFGGTIQWQCNLTQINLPIKLLCSGLLKELKVAQLFKKDKSFNISRMFIVMLTTARDEPPP
jgi:hypothetical protein